MSIEVLKACPFCGSEETFTRSWEHENGGTWWLAKCSRCGCSTQNVCQAEAHAVADWNRRPSPPTAWSEADVERAARAYCASAGDCGHSACDPGVSCGCPPTELNMDMMRAALAALTQPHHPTASVEAVALTEDEIYDLRVAVDQCDADAVDGDDEGHVERLRALVDRLALTAQQHPALGSGGPTEGPEKGRSEGPQEASPESGDFPGLHRSTASLVNTFAGALAAKLRRAEEKYGHTDGWATDDWEDECRAQLVAHIVKGDPLDVAAYAAFCWARGWSTANARRLPSIAAPRPGVAKTAAERRRLREAQSSVATEATGVDPSTSLSDPQSPPPRSQERAGGEGE